ncbi:MAG: TetR family transcriptional regulator, partial [Acidimicrobiia bacterium]
ASIDADAAELWARFQHQRRVGLNEFAVALAHKTERLRYDEDTITDTMWTLAPDAYLRLVHDAGWPVERFETWLADLLQRLFVE